MERPHIVIVGDGPAGLSLAQTLGQNKDIRTTIILPQPPNALSQLNYRTTTPFIGHTTAGLLGISPIVDRVDSLQFGLIAKKRLTLALARHMSKEIIGRNGLMAIDAESLRLQLFNNLHESNNPITIYNGKATELQMAGQSVTGVTVEGQGILAASLVIDATGRNARLASQLDASLVKVNRVPQDSTILGGYVDLSHRDLRKQFPAIDNNVIVSFLPGRLNAVIAPTERLAHSPATHVLLFEGKTDNVQQAMRHAKGTTPTDKRFDVMQLLAKGTKWEALLANIQTIDRTVFFTSKDALHRRSTIDGLTFIGDAQGYVNPIFSSGIRYIAKDGNLLATLLSSHPIDQAIKIYSDEMQNIFTRRLKQSRTTFKVLLTLPPLKIPN